MFAVDQPGRQRWRKLSTIEKFREHHLVAFDGQRAGSDCVEGNLEIRHSVIFRIGHMSGAHVDLH
jgi:hypothetical protein